MQPRLILAGQLAVLAVLLLMVTWYRGLLYDQHNSEREWK